MKSEYLIFNILVFSGPIFFGLQKKFGFRDKIFTAFISAFFSAIPFVFWDALVTNIHWSFSENYILGIKFWGLPLEEIMFFISVPFACIFLWEMIIQNSQDRFSYNKFYFFSVSASFFFLSFLLFYFGKIYSGLVFLSLLVMGIIDFFGSKIAFRRHFHIFSGFVLLAIIIFNGYLTARPVVLYSSKYITNLRFFTIPLEDIGYGFSLIYLAIAVYEKLKKLINVRKKTILTK
jgi:lycopene cyclase domain-containing protein